MENNEIMTTEIEETTENEESKKFNPFTGAVVLLAAYGTYCLVLETATAVKAARKLAKRIKAKRTESVDNDVVEDDIFDEE